MTMFSFIGTGHTNHRQLVAALSRQADFMGDNRRFHPGLWLPDDFLASVGEEFRAEDDDGAGKMTPKACFSNTRRLVARNHLVNYCEGYAYSPSLGLAFLHAWGTVSHGNVIDPTLKNPHEHLYIGLQFSARAYLAATTNCRHDSVFDTGRGLNYDFIYERCPNLKKG